MTNISTTFLGLLRGRREPDGYDADQARSSSSAASDSALVGDRKVDRCSGKDMDSLYGKGDGRVKRPLHACAGTTF